MSRRRSGAEAKTGAEACHARRLTKVDENCPNCSTSGPSSRRQALVESESLSVTCDPVPVVSCLKHVAVSKSLEELAREVARV